MSLRKIYTIIVFLPLYFTTSVNGQFILPEDAYSTHRDQDVVRVESAKAEIRGIRARKSSGHNGEVEISWYVIDKNAQLAVVRSEKMISSLGVLQTAKVISLLDPGTSSFLDTIINPGEYYYAVISYKNLKDQTAILISGDNYTTNPVVFELKDLPSNEKALSEFVSGIKTEVIDQRSVRIKWSYEFVANVSLLIYRSTSPINDENSLKNALRIGTVPASKNYFDDIDGAGGDFYYAVMVQDPFGIEKKIFKEGNNYTTTALKKPEVLPDPVKSLKGFKVESNILLSWYDSKPSLTDKYIIYRSFQPILSEDDISGATILDKVSSGTFNYTDKNVSEGKYYYAILTQNSLGTVQKAIIPGENTLIKPVSSIESERKESQTEEKQSQSKIETVVPQKSDEIIPEVIPSLFYDVEARNEGGMIRISWKPDTELLKKASKEDTYYHLFRFSKKPSNLGDLDLSSYIAKIPIENTYYLDHPSKDGFYYYAVFITTRKGLLPSTLRFGDNLIGPVLFKKSVSIPPTGVYREESKSPDQERDFGYFHESSHLGMVQLNDLLRRTYVQKNYNEAITGLKPYRNSQSLEIRARANLYLAISSYNLGNYNEALRYIMDSSVRTVYKDRADFWYKQILEKMSE